MKQELIFHSLSVSKAIRTYKFCIWCCMQTHKSIMLIKTLSTNDVILHLQFSLLCEFLLKNWSQLDIFHPENISYTRKSWYGTCCISLKTPDIFFNDVIFYSHLLWSSITFTVPSLFSTPFSSNQVRYRVNLTLFKKL